MTRFSCLWQDGSGNDYITKLIGDIENNADLGVQKLVKFLRVHDDRYFIDTCQRLTRRAASTSVSAYELNMYMYAKKIMLG